MSTPRSSTTTIIAAMRALARDIESPDRVANAAILEAAERLYEMHGLLVAVEGMGRNLPESFCDEVRKAIK